MNKKVFPLVLAGFLLLPHTVFAINKPTAGAIPQSIDADFFTLELTVDAGAKVNVIGGPTFVPPVTDGLGSDEKDGKVKVTIGLSQNTTNVFSITAEKDGQFSEALQVEIVEKDDVNKQSLPGDNTAPDIPKIDSIPDTVKAWEYTITGSSESNAMIYAKNTDGSEAGKVQAQSNGLFKLSVNLTPGKTNRFNLYAEDAAKNKSGTVQVVIKVVEPDQPKPEEAPEEVKSEKEEEQPEEQVSFKSEDFPFVDVKSHWSKSFVEKIYNEGIVKGKTNTEFAPDDEITRAELLKVALKAFGHEIQGSVESVSFPDIKKGDWFTAYVEAAVELEIASGYDDGFRPNQKISRAAALKILLEASELDLGDGVVDFSDVKSGDWFRKYVAFAKENNIIGGYEDGTFRPNRTITRAEVAKITVKIMELKAKLSDEPTI